MTSKTEFLSDLAPVHRALEAWRKTRQHRQPIPEDLWMKVTVLARSHGVSPVSQALGLDYNDYTTMRVQSLKKEKADSTAERKGIFTTSIISKVGAHQIALFCVASARVRGVNMPSNPFSSNRVNTANNRSQVRGMSR